MQKLIEWRVFFSSFLQHQPNHYQFMVKVLSRPHHFNLLTFLQSHLVHLQNLSNKRACNLPSSFSIQKVSDVSVDVAKQRLFNRTFIFFEVLLFNSLIDWNFLFSFNVKVTHFPLQLLFKVQSSSKLLIAIIKAMMVVFISFNWLVIFALFATYNTAYFFTNHHQRPKGFLNCGSHATQKGVGKRLRFRILLALEQVFPSLVSCHEEA